MNIKLWATMEVERDGETQEVEISAVPHPPEPEVGLRRHFLDDIEAKRSADGARVELTEAEEDEAAELLWLQVEGVLP